MRSCPGAQVAHVVPPQRSSFRKLLQKPAARLPGGKSEMDSLVAYLVAAMVGWVPLYAQPNELPDEVMDRYESIARDAATVALDPDEAPLFEGPDGRTRTALLMLSVASFE